MLKALRLAYKQGARTALDIDFRPNLWKLSGHDDSDNRLIASGEVLAKLQSTLPLFDLIVGTEEEIFIAGSSTDLVTSFRKIRPLTEAVLIVKRGSMGTTIFEGDIPDDLDGGIIGEGLPIEAFNLPDAGDGLMAGLLKGWMSGETWPTSLKYAKTCGAPAMAVHRPVRPWKTSTSSARAAWSHPLGARIQSSNMCIGRPTAGGTGR